MDELITPEGVDEDTRADVFKDAWNAHKHPELGDDVPPHMHAPDADWSLHFVVPMTFRHDDDLDIIELMEFRGVTMNMRAQMEVQRQSTSLEAMPKSERQFTILAYNMDAMFTDSLIEVVDQALKAHGIDPPCQLQIVDSSNIRSFGFVIVQAPDEPVPTSGVLYVAFKGGGLYRYVDVPLDAAQLFVEAESKGTFFHAYIKGEYDFTKVGG